MIKVKSLLVIIFLCILSAECDYGNKEFEMYHFVNESGHHLDVQVYLEDDLEISLSLDHEEVWMSGKIDVTRGGKRSGNGVYIPEIGEPDSVLIVFDSKILTYNSKSEQLRHLLNFSDNYEVTIKENTTFFTYTFTEQDYENAALIED